MAASAMWLLNAVRLAVLIALGDAGHQRIALGGFHSQAGWIAFNLIGLGLLSVARRSSLFARGHAQPASTELINPSLPYLVPFLALVAAGMLSQSLSANAFEAWYPLRLAATAVALWYFRAELLRLNWRFGWQAIVWGGLVFVVWLALAPAASSPSSADVAAGVAGLPTLARFGWLACRVLSAVVTVPIAEELAFRGYLLRRCVAAEFDGVDWRASSWFAWVASSLAFGVLHGDRWLSGAIAGACYAQAMRATGRIGEAAAAHGITNGLLITWVLVSGRWEVW